MKKILLVMIFGFLTVTGCSFVDRDSENEIQTSNAWVYSFVKWENENYVVTEEEVKEEKIGAKIGEVTSYSDQESSDTSGNFSNKYEEGTKYYEITDINQEEAIAVKI
ncbi:hypothetical protein A1A1_13292 [Planococcus antarcticus DSM 14505]|uniref:Lipoprotein n=1 Tax=Planococcus antarcticus DSM 14505 TaxID=1185653 RepID=A0AA87LTE8_9BACL|nr:hypothetical protein [Planococcus antarcticus]EIM06087.1 hypothetical protein A1A1_13292 [Planococcus antarcticus DSM 14505]